jgi:hypothetical protein
MKSRGQRRSALAKMRAFQAEVKAFGETGRVIRRNLLNGTVLWSQSADTDWYFYNHQGLNGSWNRPKGYLRLVATWPEPESVGLAGSLEGLLYYPNRHYETMTGWGCAAFFVVDQDGDRPLTQQEISVLEATLAAIDAILTAEVLEAQAEAMEPLAVTGFLTEDEVETASHLGIL